jgi:hypothetical protein
MIENSILSLELKIYEKKTILAKKKETIKDGAK